MAAMLLQTRRSGDDGIHRHHLLCSTPKLLRRYLLSPQGQWELISTTIQLLRFSFDLLPSADPFPSLCIASCPAIKPIYPHASG